ncbi:outer membrane protein assembly factor, partial [Saprospiraceae bacterium]|nr:outer membrane protein assembly factor [Saprospiraceae bacterium]
SSDLYGRFINAGVTVSLGTRLKWPDDNFIVSTAINIQNISLDNWQRVIFLTDDGDLVNEGSYRNFSINQTIARSTVNNPLFPQEGSSFSLSVQLTPPYSLFSDKNYGDLAVEEKFKWLEYHKWRFQADWYTTIVGKLVFRANIKIGMMGAYNDAIGISPFERFQLGGDGLNNSQLNFYTGTDIIRLRGYEPEDLVNNRVNEFNANDIAPTPIYDKFSLELRYPVSLNPSSTIYVLAFAEGGNAWKKASDFNPFDIKRSAGVGLRVFLPMFGLLGFDYGIGFDKNVGNNNFSDLTKFSIILGFEPE